MSGFLAGMAFDYAKSQALGAYNNYNYHNPYGSGGGYGMQYDTGRNITGGYYGFKDGGMVPKTGRAKVHKGELVVPKKDVKKTKAAMSKANIPVPTGNGQRCSLRHIPKN
jgi:hypothetical protein